MIKRMRLDFPLAAKFERWSEEGQLAIGDAITEAIESGDAEVLAYWSMRIEEGAGRWRARCKRVSEAEAYVEARRSARAT